MKYFRLLVCSALAVFLLSGCLNQTTREYPDPLLADLPAHIEKRIAEWKIPGVAVGVIKDGKVIFKRGFGYRDVENKLPVTTETMFPIASCSKAFTALSLEIAAHKGLLDLDAPIKSYYKNFDLMDSVSAEKVTARDFLEHRTGLNGYGQMPEVTGASRSEIFEKLELFDLSAAYRKRFIYSNLGYAMAAHLIERGTDESWENYVSQKILHPLKMKSSCFTLDEATRTGDFALAYQNLYSDGAHRDTNQFHYEAYTPAGGMISNIEDLLKWVQFLLNEGQVGKKQLLPSENMNEMWQPYTKLADQNEFRTEVGYGYGWYTENYRGHTMIYHGGLGYGYISQVSFMPEEKLGVIVLTNLYYQHLEQVLTHEIYDRLLGLSETDLNQRNLEVCKQIDGMRQAYDAFWDEAEPRTLSLEELKPYTGKYHHDLYGEVDISNWGDGLKLTFQTGIGATMEFYSANTFGTESNVYLFSHQKIGFYPDENGQIQSFQFPLDGNLRTFNRKKIIP